MDSVATLVLEDGTTMIGESFGASADAVFELVFNTTMTGYQEVLTDPSYRGQGVLFTVSHIGNVGINPEDYESSTPQVSAVVTRAVSPVVSNWRASRDLQGWLSEFGVPGITRVDTRRLTRILRDRGTMKAALSTIGTSAADLLAQTQAWQGLDGQDMVQEVTCSASYGWEPDKSMGWVQDDLDRFERERIIQNYSSHVVLFDFGAKHNILRHLSARGARITVVPATASAAEVLALQPQGVMLSNGPGDPAGLPHIVNTVKELLNSGIPIFGICLGHQLLGLALGGTTRRLKFGHHGGNHPVKHLATGKVEITSQNHNYFVDSNSLDPAVVEITHLSLNDHTVEGLQLVDKPVFSVQYHPEAAPGPHDAHHLFDHFFTLMMKKHTNTNGEGS